MTDRPLRVALTSRYDVRLAGGIESFVATLVPQLRSARPHWQITSVHAFASVSRLSRIPFVCDLLAGLALMWRTRDADVVLINGAEYAFARAFVPGLRKKTIVVWHGTRAGEIPALTEHRTLPVRIYARLENRLQRAAFAAPRHIAVGDNVRGELLAAYGTAPDLTVIPNGAPQFTPAGRTQTSRNVLWIGTNPYKKGLDLALAACRIVRETRPDLTLTVVGVAASEVPPETWVLNRGVVPHALMDAVYDEAAVLLFSTRYEACSMAMLEAMARGKAIVASAAVAWMLGSERGHRSAPEFAAAIDVALTDDGNRRLRDLALAALPRFDARRSVERYVREIEAIAS